MAWRPSQDRLQDVQYAKDLRATGKTISQIALALGIGRTTASDYINHPETGSLYRGRKRQYQMCPKCGGRMSYGADQCMRCRKKERG